uniref:Uncharacterized protein n=1 Tax=Brassica campestris TaxID=3711 RepID=A0A3P5Y5G8_BRACM|nr:unnamed protein product [Brassica rapa]
MVIDTRRLICWNMLIRIRLLSTCTLLSIKSSSPLKGTQGPRHMGRYFKMQMECSTQLNLRYKTQGVR